MKSARSVPYPKELWISRPHDTSYRDMETNGELAKRANECWAEEQPYIRYIEYFHYASVLLDLEKQMAQTKVLEEQIALLSAQLLTP